MNEIYKIEIVYLESGHLYFLVLIENITGFFKYIQQIFQWPLLSEQLLASF